MVSVVVFLPVVVALVLAGMPSLRDMVARGTWVAVTVIEVGLAAWMWAAESAPPGGLAFEQKVAWIPGVHSSYHVGVDGLSLPLVVLTNVLFLACAIYALRQRERPRTHAALFLALQTTCLGLFVAQDLLVFFVFFDLSIVGMYFVIAGWGHGNAARSALKFFLYTFFGSLALLLGFIGLYLAADPHTFDMVELTRQTPLNGHGTTGALVLAAILLGLAIKTPTFPFHTWLPPAHTDAPAAGSAILAGVLLKMGTYGFVRIAMPMLPQAWRAWAWVIVAVGIVSVLYGALVSLAQTDFKRMVAYTSVNHMGYIVLAVGVAGLVTDSSAEAAQVAITGAVTQMVSHGLLTGALFLLAGMLRERAGTYRMASFGGLAAAAPRYSALFAVAVFASLGIPAFSGFIAEFQIFAGSIGITVVAAAALPGIVLIAAVLLRALQQMLTGPQRGSATGFADARPTEVVSIGFLLVLSALIGVLPRLLLDVIEPAAAGVTALVGR